jgi:hypothetical protein
VLSECPFVTGHDVDVDGCIIKKEYANVLRDEKVKEGAVLLASMSTFVVPNSTPAVL